jgi:endoglucanase
MKFVAGVVALGALLLHVAEAKIYFAGVAESGGEFGAWSADKVVGTGLPGTFGREYSFISESTVDTFVDVHKVSTRHWLRCCLACGF